MSVEIAAASVREKKTSMSSGMKKIVGLIAGGAMTVLVSAGVWVLAAVLPSKTDGPFKFLENICNWLYTTPVSVGIRESTLLFPAIEGVHLLGIALSVGMLCWFDLRLLGLVMKDEPVSKVWTRVMPTAITGFVLMFLTGALLFWGSSWALGSRHPVRDAVISLALSLATFYGFYLGLGVLLPAGVLEGVL